MNESLVDNEFIRNAIDRYSNLVFRVSYQYVQNKPDAEDVLQEVFVALWDYLNHASFQNDEHLKAWLIRVTINKSINFAKSNARRAKKQEPDWASFGKRTEPQYYDLENVLNKLSAIDREVIYLHYYEGYYAKEIAVILDMTEKSILKRLSRARLKLKTYISEEGV